MLRTATVFLPVLLLLCLVPASVQAQSTPATDPETLPPAPPVLDASPARPQVPARDLLTAPLEGTDAPRETPQIMVAGSPIAIPDAYVTTEGVPLAVDAPGFLANDIDPDGGPLRLLRAGGLANGRFTRLVTNGAFTYEPDAGFVGTETITYDIDDLAGNEATGTATIEVLPDPNRAPIAVPDAYVTTEGVALAVDAPGPLANDFEPDGGPLRLLRAGGLANGRFTRLVTNGAFTYEPDVGFVGTETITYDIDDLAGNEATSTFTIEVLPDPNRAPVAINDAYVTLMNTPLAVDAPGFLANDFEPDGQTLRLLRAGGLANGRFTRLVTNGAFTYEPDVGFVGTETITYDIDDLAGNEATGTATIYVIDPDNPVVCSFTTLAETVGQAPSGAGEVTVVFSNPDGIEAVTFTVLTNFTVTAPGLTDVGSNRWETSGSPQSVTVTVTQADQTVAEAAYFAVVESVCPTEADGTLETDFDPPYEFEVVPARFALESSYPNPFNPATTVVFALPEASEVRLAVYDVLGREVATLVQGSVAAGRHEVRWDAREMAGGVYLVRLEAGGRVDTYAVTLLK